MDGHDGGEHRRDLLLAAVILRGEDIARAGWLEECERQVGDDYPHYRDTKDDDIGNGENGK